MRRHGDGTRRCLLALALPLAAAGIGTGTAEAAKKHHFKVALTISQSTDWAQTVRHPRAGEGYCGSRDVHYVYSGEGDGQLKARVRGARLTFKGSSALMQSTGIRVPGTVITNSNYTVARQGTPDEDCEVPPPPPLGASPDGACNPLVRRAGVARAFLLAVRGRLSLTGAFARDDKLACADPSIYTGAVGFGGRPSRRDVNALIARKRVRSIDLVAKDDGPFGLGDLSDFGANSTLLTASGEGNATWRIKLTRIR